MPAGAAVFLAAFSGCNLWSGREQDRGRRGLPVSATRILSAPTAHSAARYGLGGRAARRQPSPGNGTGDQRQTAMWC